MVETAIHNEIHGSKTNFQPYRKVYLTITLPESFLVTFFDDLNFHRVTMATTMVVTTARTFACKGNDVGWWLGLLPRFWCISRRCSSRLLSAVTLIGAKMVLKIA